MLGGFAWFWVFWDAVSLYREQAALNSWQSSLPKPQCWDHRQKPPCASDFSLWKQLPKPPSNSNPPLPLECRNTTGNVRDLLHHGSRSARFPPLYLACLCLWVYVCRHDSVSVGRVGEHLCHQAPPPNMSSQHPTGHQSGSKPAYHWAIWQDLCALLLLLLLLWERCRVFWGLSIGLEKHILQQSHSPYLITDGKAIPQRNWSWSRRVTYFFKMLSVDSHVLPLKFYIWYYHHLSFYS